MARITNKEKEGEKKKWLHTTHSKHFLFPYNIVLAHTEVTSIVIYL